MRHGVPVEFGALAFVDEGNDAGGAETVADQLPFVAEVLACQTSLGGGHLLVPVESVCGGSVLLVHFGKHVVTAEPGFDHDRLVVVPGRENQGAGTGECQ